MKYLAPVRRIACVVILLLGAFSTECIPADEASVTTATAEEANPALAYQNFSNAIEPIVIAASEYSPSVINSELIPAPVANKKFSAAEEATATAPVHPPIAPKKPIVVALAESTSPDATNTSRAPIAIPPASSQWPAPARFFTINQVLAKHQQITSKSSAVHLAAIDPKSISDASPTPTSLARSGEPFGLFTFRAPEGPLWAKWRKVEADIQAAAPALARCRAESSQCTPTAARFVAIIKQAEVRQGRAKFELVNERINASLHYMTDMAQWGLPDVWSAPLDANNQGSFNTGFGDCEDYAIAKYVALREAGVSASDLKLLLVRDNFVHLDHAVLAAQDNGRWLILDNRWTSLIEDREAKQFMPLFAVDEGGVKLFASLYVAKQPANNKTVDIDVQHFVAGADGSEPILPPLISRMTGLGMAPFLL